MCLRIFTRELYSLEDSHQEIELIQNGFLDTQNVRQLVESLPSMHGTLAQHKPGLLVHACNLSTQETEAGEPESQGQS